MVVLVLVVWVSSGFLLRAINSGEIIDGTRMGGVALGDKTRSQAAELIAEIEPQKVKLSGPRRTFTVPAPRAGLVVDVDASVERAWTHPGAVGLRRSSPAPSSCPEIGPSSRASSRSIRSG